MITSTQYALLIGIPTGTIVVCSCVASWYLRRFLRIVNANFDRIEQTMAEAQARSKPYKSVFE